MSSESGSCVAQLKLRFMLMGRAPEEACLWAGLVKDSAEIEQFHIKEASLDLISLAEQPRNFDGPVCMKLWKFPGWNSASSDLSHSKHSAAEWEPVKGGNKCLPRFPVFLECEEEQRCAWIFTMLYWREVFFPDCSIISHHAILTGKVSANTCFGILLNIIC